jgi:hypothetical protein
MILHNYKVNKMARSHCRVRLKYFILKVINYFHKKKLQIDTQSHLYKKLDF